MCYLLVNSNMFKTPRKATVHVFSLPIYYNDSKYARIYVTRIMLSFTIEQSKSIPFTLYTHSFCQCFNEPNEDYSFALRDVTMRQHTLRQSACVLHRRRCGLSHLPVPRVSSRTFPETGSARCLK